MKFHISYPQLGYHPFNAMTYMPLAILTKLQENFHSLNCLRPSRGTFLALFSYDYKIIAEKRSLLCNAIV